MFGILLYNDNYSVYCCNIIIPHIKYVTVALLYNDKIIGDCVKIICSFAKATNYVYGV